MVVANGLQRNFNYRSGGHLFRIKSTLVFASLFFCCSVLSLQGACGGWLSQSHLIAKQIALSLRDLLPTADQPEITVLSEVVQETS
jgi:hypothetical protein